jgi:Zn-dependent protease with chaperone function
MNSWLVICLGLAALVTINAIASLVAAALWFALGQRVKSWPTGARAWLLLTLRLFPILGALTAVLTLFIPAYLAYEPRPADEEVNLKVGILAVVATFGLLFTGWRALTSWRATRRLTAEWLRRAEGVEAPGLAIPAFHFAHPFPVLAIVGVFRPRLFIADCVIESLDDHELAAAIAHEAAHLTARDHFKLGLIRACRDVFALLPGSRALERAWAAEAEAAADERAALASSDAALNLAVALIKIARLTPAPPPVLPAGVYLIGDDAGGIEYRVRRLMLWRHTAYGRIWRRSAPPAVNGAPSGRAFLFHSPITIQS